MRRLPLRRLPALAARLLLGALLASALLVLALRWLPPPGSALMVERKLESWLGGEPIDLQRDWRPWQELPDDLKVAAIAAEDQKFAEHWGFDLGAIRAALAHNERGGNLRGASTLSQQVAKNLFLWSGRSWLRKGLEVWFTLLIEALTAGQTGYAATFVVSGVIAAVGSVALFARRSSLAARPTLTP
jgi:monofunctional biosynthetic peptidoglycan transglycosylase